MKNRGSYAAWPMVALLTLALAYGVQAADWVVPALNTPNIAAALRQAREGDRILVAPGVYAEHLVIERAVTLSGRPGAEMPVIDGGGTGRVIEVRAPGAVLQGVAVRNSGDRLEETDACIYLHGEAAGAQVRDSRMEDCAFGIWINGTAGVEIVGNIIRGRPHRIFSDRGNGINAWQLRGGRIHGNDIGQVRDGVNVSVTTDSAVTDNRMHDLRFGIHYMYSDSNRVTGNVTCDSQVGLALMFSKRLEVVGNIAIRNRDHGILFRSILDSHIESNRVQGNGKGFFLNDSSYNTILANRVSGNDIGVHVTGGSGDNRIIGNIFAENPVQVRYSWNFPMHWDDGQSGNYWSDYLGWDLDGDRIGDRSHHAAGRMDRLMFRYPVLKLLAASPVVGLMQSLEARFPVLRPPSVIDDRPAMDPPRLSGPAAEDIDAAALCGAPPMQPAHSAEKRS